MVSYQQGDRNKVIRHECNSSSIVTFQYVEDLAKNVKAQIIIIQVIRENGLGRSFFFFFFAGGRWV